MVIYQGSNTPITITFSDPIDSISDLHIILLLEDTVLKHWFLDDVIKHDNVTISCPLSQEDTITFDEGDAILEVKWLEDDIVQMAKPVKIKIVQRYDHHILGE